MKRGCKKSDVEFITENSVLNFPVFTKLVLYARFVGTIRYFEKYKAQLKWVTPKGYPKTGRWDPSWGLILKSRSKVKRTTL